MQMTQLFLVVEMRLGEFQNKKAAINQLLAITHDIYKTFDNV